jgi:hypothetical protein
MNQTSSSDHPETQNIPHVMKTGVLKKRSARLHQWNTRYFMLEGPKLSYKLKASDSAVRDTFDLFPGCLVTQVTESKSGISGKKLYSFWIVWPAKGDEKAAHPPNTNAEGEVDSGDEGEKDNTNEGEGKELTKGTRNLHKVAEQEAQNLKSQKSQHEKTVTELEARDGGLSIGTKVAAVAVGGVVVGALSAGIGVAPYMTVVGMTLAASGGAVAWQTMRRPADNRLILACEGMEEAIEWKTAIGKEIAILEEACRPSVQSSADRKVISSLLDKTVLQGEGIWKRVAVVEGLRILEHTIVPFATPYGSGVSPSSSLFLDWNSIRAHTNRPKCSDVVVNHAVMNELNDLYSAKKGVNTDESSLTRCRRSQTVIKATPMNCLLMIMESKRGMWPKFGSMKVVKEIDDHADIVEVETIIDCRSQGGKDKTVFRRQCFNRFWRLDDDGVYLITLNTTVVEENPPGTKVSKAFISFFFH